jgi:uncharacterized protein
MAQIRFIVECSFGREMPMPDASTTAVTILGKFQSRRVEASRDDPKTAWLSLLALPAAAKTGLSLLELDGYLTGVIVTPQSEPIAPSRWIAGLWGDAEPVFDDDAQIFRVMGAVYNHYSALVLDIDRALKRLQADRVCDYRPMFMPREGKPTHDAVRRWTRGFWRAMALAPKAWSALVEDDRTKILIGPFAAFINLGDQGSINIPGDVDAIRDESAAAIPPTILTLHKLATMLSESNPRKDRKTGRNDPCPCGSGGKYKRCCGRVIG